MSQPVTAIKPTKSVANEKILDRIDGSTAFRN